MQTTSKRFPVLLSSLILSVTLFIIYIPTSAAEGSILISDYPESVRQLLARYKIWQTVVVSSAQTVPNFPPLIATKLSKKWIVKGGSQGARSLTEVTSLSLDANASSGSLSWKSEHVDLSNVLSVTPFYLEAAFEKDPHFRIRLMDEDRFEISVHSDSGLTRIIFLPQFTSKKPNTVWSERPVNIWTAPLGANKNAMERILHLSKPDNAYLNHDLDQTREVLIDQSFPGKFIPAVKHVLEKWNSALGKKFFILRVGKTKVDPADCLSSKKLCIDWIGSDLIPWSGVGASTASTFDPESGVILGGLITFSNGAGGESLKTAPEADVEKITTGNFDYDWVVRTYLRKKEFSNFLSPLPEAIVESILLHEVGHYNGLSHNFQGSRLGDVKQPSLSIMEYMPFPVVGKFIDIEDYDKQMIRLVYSGKLPLPNYRFGSDEESIPSSYQRKANVNPFTLGDPSRWFIAMANASAAGVFETTPGDQKDILTYLSDFIDSSRGATKSQVLRVNRFLCGDAQKERIQSRIAAVGKKLSCECSLLPSSSKRH